VIASQDFKISYPKSQAAKHPLVILGIGGGSSAELVVGICIALCYDSMIPRSMVQAVQKGNLAVQKVLQVAVWILLPRRLINAM